MASGGFTADWLALREPVDHTSINAELRRKLLAYFAGRPDIGVVDLGSGTGSNYRGLAPWLSAIGINAQSWTLTDIDDDLLQRAGAGTPIDGTSVAVQTLDLKTEPLDAVFTGADLITAAAFFDIVSAALIKRVAEACAATGCAFYTVLTYDGMAAWLPEHAANRGMRHAFNAHQRRDKGMGAALGPDATAALVEAFEARGYRVETAPSPWIVGREHAAMRAQLDKGWAEAVDEIGEVNPAAVEDWRQGRGSGDAITIVGHQDVLALPSA